MRFNLFIHEEVLNNENPYIRESGYFLSQTSILLVFVSLLAGAHHWFNQSYPAAIINFCVSFFVFSNLWFFSKIGNFKLCTHIHLLFCILFILLHILLSGAYFSFHLIWLPCIPLFATCLLSKQATINWTLFCVFGVLSIYLLKWYGVELVAYEIPKNKVLPSSALTICLSTWVCLSLINFIRRKELSSLRAYEILEAKHKHLLNQVYFEFVPLASEARAIGENIDFKWNDSSEERNSLWMKDRLHNLNRKLLSLIDVQRDIELQSSSTESLDLVTAINQVRRIFESTLERKNIIWEFLPLEEEYVKVSSRLQANQALVEAVVLYPIFKYFIHSEKSFSHIQMRLRLVDQFYIHLEITGTGKIESTIQPKTFLEEESSFDDTFIASTLALYNARLSMKETKADKKEKKEFFTETIGIVFNLKK